MSFDPCKEIEKAVKPALKPINQGLSGVHHALKDIQDDANHAIKDVADTYNGVIDEIQKGFNSVPMALNELAGDVINLTKLLAEAYLGYLSAIFSITLLPIFRLIWSNMPMRVAVYAGTMTYVILMLGAGYNIWHLYLATSGF